MLIDLSFLQPGAVWPPASEQARINGYAQNRQLFEADHETVFSASWKRIIRERDAESNELPPGYDMVINYPKLITVSTAGLLFNKAPGIVAGDNDDNASMGAAKEIEERSGLQNVLYTTAIDVSRYGDGLLYVRRDAKGQGIIDLTRPDVWFPVMDGRNIRNVQYHVLATPYSIDRPGSMGTTTTTWYLQAEIHSRGRVEIRKYELTRGVSVNGIESFRIGNELENIREDTGLSEFPIIPVHNLIASDRVYGIDDYADVKKMVCDLEVRMGQISKILDRHSSPSMQGPEEALDVQFDSVTGATTRTFTPGKYFVNKSGGEQGNISYLTWDAQLEANFKYIDKLIELICTTSEMGALLASAGEKFGAVPSGAAMRRMLHLAIGKISRIRNNFEPAIKKAFVLASELSGSSLVGKPLYIKWADSLPRDPVEDANVASVRTGSKQTQSVTRAIQALDDLSEEEARRELDAIKDDQADEMVKMVEAVQTDDKTGSGADDEGV